MEETDVAAEVKVHPRHLQALACQIKLSRVRRCKESQRCIHRLAGFYRDIANGNGGRIRNQRKAAPLLIECIKKVVFMRLYTVRVAEDSHVHRIKDALALRTRVHLLNADAPEVVA